MDHTKINYDLVLELMSWLVTEDHTDLEVCKHYMCVHVNDNESQA